MSNERDDRLAATSAAAEALGLPRDPPDPHPYYDLEPRQIETARGSIRYFDLGDGPPLLLVHGLMTSSYSWRYVMQALAESHRVVVPDLPGSGESAQDPSAPHGPEAMSVWLADFMDRLDIPRWDVIGNSLGGVFSLRFALDHPGRVSRLGIMHSPGFPEMRIRLMRGLLSVPPLRAAFVAYLRRRGDRFVSKNVHYARPIMSGEEVVEYGGIFRTDAGAKTFARILRDSLPPAELKRLWADVASKPPEMAILLLWARQDVMVPAKFGDRYKARLPNADLVWMDGVSHFMHVDGPDATLAHLRAFLETP